MEKDTIIVSMTTWPPRAEHAIMAMRSLVAQEHSEPVHFVLVLSKDEWNVDSEDYRANPTDVLNAMEHFGVEVIWDNGNIMSHKKLIPTLEHYPDNPILVVDDDVLQDSGWLQAFIDEQKTYPTDIIYGHSSSRVSIIHGKICEGVSQRGVYTFPGRRTYNEKPANGAAGTLYPSGTFKDERFFDRKLFMQLCPTSDETWQWAWCVMTGKTYRCLPCCNHPAPIGKGEYALFRTNITKYTQYHNAIAEMFPEYKEELAKLIEANPRKYELKYEEL